MKGAAQGRALVHGRAFVIPEDVSSVVKQVFTHRISLNHHAADPLEERGAVEAALTRIIAAVPQPV